MEYYRPRKWETNLTGVEWKPVGTNTAPFYGIFDGNGHTIKNLNINLPNQDQVGLFGYNKGTVRNLVLLDVQVKGRNNTGDLELIDLNLDSEFYPVKDYHYVYFGGLKRYW